MKKLITFSALVVAWSALAACTGGHSHDGIEVSEARINPPLPGQTTGVAFMALENHGADDMLVAVSSPLSDQIELHTHEMEDGIMKMRRVQTYELPSGRTVRLQPGGLHIMIFDADVAGQDETTLTLDYLNAPDVTLVVPILPRGEMPEDSGHAGH